MRLSQGLALRMGAQNVTVRPDLPSAEESGGLTVLHGTHSELASLLPTLPAESASTPTLAFAALPGNPASALIVSGPTPQAVQAAADRLVEQATTENSKERGQETA